MDRVFTSLRLKTFDDDARIVEGVATTPSRDRANDEVMPEGAEFDLGRRSIPFCLDHDTTQVIGEVIEAEVSRAGIRFRAQCAKIARPGRAKDDADRYWTMLKAGLRKYVSIGFRPLAAEPLADGGWRYRAWEWLELSACAVPCQPDAAITSLKRAPRQRQRGSTVRVPNGLPTVHVAPTPRLKLPVVVLPEFAAIARQAGDAEYQRRTGEAPPRSAEARARWIKEKQIVARVQGRVWTGPDEMAEALRKAGKLPEPARSYRFPDLARGN